MSNGVSIHIEKSMNAPVALGASESGFKQNGGTRTVACALRQISEGRDQIVERQFVGIAATLEPIIHLFIAHARVQTII
jgi:hypothetical protein